MRYIIYYATHSKMSRINDHTLRATHITYTSYYRFTWYQIVGIRADVLDINLYRVVYYYQVFQYYLSYY